MDKLDPDIFEQDNCNDYDCNQKYMKCKSIKKLFAALKLYSTLNIIGDENDRDVWNKFMNQIYHNLIDDYIHFNNNHSHELENINKAIIDNKIVGLIPCQISKCLFTSRHHNQASKTNQNNLTPNEHFYKQTMDALHFYLFHCFDVGLRVEEKDVDEKKETKTEYFDATFSRLNEMILERQYITKEFDRFSLKKNNKFNIEVENNEHTFLDSLYEYLKSKNISPNNIRNFIEDEEYESDCIESDINISGNIEQEIPKKCIEALKQFITMIKISSGSFRVGFRFYYWDYFKDLKQLPDDEQCIQDDISTYSSINDLFIVCKYNSFKEEIAHYYPHFIFKQFTEEVVVKVNEYIYSKIVKKTKPVSKWTTPYTEYYGIEKDSRLTFNHLVSMIFYCDYSELSCAFSSSFRKVKKFETIKNIAQKQSKYYWFSKYLRETVEVYGQCSAHWEKERGLLSGPFYSGMSILLNIPAFNIHLCAPTSTSMHPEVASKFSGPDGIVIQFNNPGNSEQYWGLRGFNVSWISRYKEEAERLFIGGYCYMKIESIKVKNTNNNYKKIIYSLAYLDSCITGGDVDAKKIEVSKHDISVIKNSFAFILNKKQTIKFDKYIKDTLKTFIQSKKQITLHLFHLSSANSAIRDELMNEIKKDDIEQGIEKKKENDFTNLFQKQLLLIFQHVKTLIIDTGVEKSLSMISLLSLLELGSLNKVIVKCSIVGHNWIHSLWCSEKETLKKRYELQNYTINIKKRKFEFDPHSFLIEKQI